MHRFLCSFAVLLVSASLADLYGAPQKRVRKHPIGGTDSYVVLLKADLPNQAFDGTVRSLAATYNLHVVSTWPNAVKGFLCTGPADALERLADDARTDLVEQDVAATVPAHTSGMQWTYYTGQYMWFLDRLDERWWLSPDPMHPEYGRDGQYNMCPEGRSVHAYIIDEGVWNGHPEFEVPTRVVANIDFTDDRPDHNVAFGTDTTNACTDPPNFHGPIHGTMVGTTLAGTHVGASKTQVVSLKVISCTLQTRTDFYLAALNWIADPVHNPYYGQPAVINHSGFVPVWDSQFQSYGEAVARLVTQQNIPYFAAAGNFSADACSFSPQYQAYTNINHNGSVFVVGGTSVTTNPADPNDYRYQFWENDGVTPKVGQDSGSNAGACVSTYAPGVSFFVGINDRYFSSSYYLTNMAGTSFSSPLVAGMAARYIERQIQQTGVRPSYQQVYDFFLGQAVTPFLFEQTPPTYWLCLNLNGSTTPYRTYPTCSFRGPYQMNTASNTSNARMVYWDPGCP